MFVLPNLFTVGNIFCGFYAISLCMDSPDALRLYRAAVAIFFGMFFDMFDGRVARLTRTQSEFGVQLDSLADMVSFGAAPAFLVYRWSLYHADFLGLFCAFLFMLAAALRLARFNVLAAHESGPSKHFMGLPSPLAAGTVVAMVMASYPFERSDMDGALLVTLGGSTEPLMELRILPGVAMLVTIGLGALMVSNVRYRTFKDLKLNRKSGTILFLVGLSFAAGASLIKPAFSLTLLFGGYILLGLLEEVVFFPSRSAERRAEREQKYAEHLAREDAAEQLESAEEEKPA
jgi:CDP-diacylglycerol--serine O-phosphatidyltransferase